MVMAPAKTDFAKFLKVFIKLQNLIFRKRNYVFEISRSRASKQNIIRSYFKSLKFFLEPLQNHFVKIVHKIVKSKYFPIFKMNPTRH